MSKRAKICADDGTYLRVVNSATKRFYLWKLMFFFCLYVWKMFKNARWKTERKRVENWLWINMKITHEGFGGKLDGNSVLHVKSESSMELNQIAEDFWEILCFSWTISRKTTLVGENVGKRSGNETKAETSNYPSVVKRGLCQNTSWKMLTKRNSSAWVSRWLLVFHFIISKKEVQP